MNLTTLFRLRKPEGTDPVDVKDFNDNFDVIDAELGKRPEKTGNASNMVTSFSQAGSRANLTSGEKLAVSLGKIMKFFADLKAVAFSGSYTDLSNKPSIPSGAAANYPVANNDTTNNAGYLVTAQVAYTHGREIDQLSSDLAATKTSFQGGVDTLYNKCVSCGATPSAKTPAGIAAAIQAIFTNRYNAGYGAKTPYVNTAYAITNDQSYTINLGYAPSCICIYIPYQSGVSYRGYAMALRAGSKYQMSDESPGVINAGNIINWPVTFSNTGITFTAPTCIARGTINCEVFVG